MLPPRTAVDFLWHALAPGRCSLLIWAGFISFYLFILPAHSLVWKIHFYLLAAPSFIFGPVFFSFCRFSLGPKIKAAKNKIRTIKRPALFFCFCVYLLPAINLWHKIINRRRNKENRHLFSAIISFLFDLASAENNGQENKPPPLNVYYFIRLWRPFSSSIFAYAKNEVQKWRM